MINSSAIIMILRPMKKGDATESTYQWGQKAVKMARELGYRVIDIEKDDNTYLNVSDKIKKYEPRLIITFSHGCANSILGQNECTITKKHAIEEIVKMRLSGEKEKIEIAKNILDPFGCFNNSGMDRIGSNGRSGGSICQLKDPCDAKCFYDTNINLLKGKIIFAVACNTGLQLGRCAVAYGAETYIGYSDLFLFPTDTVKSHEIVGETQLEGLRNLLLGKSVRESEIEMKKREDTNIRIYRKIKYVAIPLRWNQKYRVIYGNQNATIYGNPIFGVPIIPFI